MSSFQPREQWTTGHDPMTDKQAAFLGKLADDKSVEIDTTELNKAQASELIDELKSGRVSNAQDATSKLPNEAHANPPESIRDPSQWTTGGEPATGKQKAYIAVLSKRAGEPAHDLGDATKAEASERIEVLREMRGE